MVAPNSQLTLRNMSISGIGPDSIYCADNTGTLVLDNVNWVQNDNYSFDQGTLNIRGNVLMSGQGFSFTYASTNTSTIFANSILTLDNLFSFAYAPSNGATDLLVFTNATSQFALRHSIFTIVPGLELTKGQLIFSQAPTINAFGTGLTLGDVTTTANDVQMLFPDSSTLTIAAGQLNYKNVDPNQTDIQIWNNNAIDFADTTTLALYTNMYIQNTTTGGSINFAPLGGRAIYMHKINSGILACCAVATDISGSWGGNFTEVCFCP